MTSRRALYGVLLAGSLVGWSDAGTAARRPAAALPAAAAEGPSVGAGILATIGGSILGSAANRLLQKVGLFEALGIGGPDPWTQEKLNEIMDRLEGLSAEIAALGQRLDLRLVTEIARKTIADQHAAFENCYVRLKDLALLRAEEPESYDRYSRALLGRAYQLIGLPPPEGLVIQDTYCALDGAVMSVQLTVLPEDGRPENDRLLVAMARLARQNGQSFEEVVRYFAWIVGIQRHAMAIVAQAHHRLGEDALLAARTEALEQSLRRQEIELLRAAEAYVAFQRPYDAPEAAAALALADAVVTRMEGAPRVVTAGLLLVRPPEGALAWPTIHQEGGEAGVALDEILAEEGDAYYGQPRTHPTPLYVYAVPLGYRAGVEVGRSDQLVFARFRTTRVTPAPTEFPLRIYGVPNPFPTLSLRRRNAATLDPESAEMDRMLLAHAEGFASAMARFELVPSPEDPRLVTLAVDQPAWGLSQVAVGPVPGEDGIVDWRRGLAARPGVSGVPLEMVPFGPEDPERFALRIDEHRWLGVGPATLPGSSDPELLAAVPVEEPFFFDVLPDGERHELSYAGSDGVRRWLFVNEQVMSASEWQLANLSRQVGDPASETASLETVPDAFAGPITGACGYNAGQGPIELFSIPIRVGGSQAVSYNINPAVTLSRDPSCSSEYYGGCWYSVDGRDYLHRPWWTSIPMLGGMVPPFLPFTFQDTFPRYNGRARFWALNPGSALRFVCEHSGCGVCVSVTSLQLKLQ